MPKDRDQLTPADPDDADHLVENRGQGTAGSGLDELSADDSLEETTTLDPDQPG